jgi:hypothetical protein
MNVKRVTPGQSAFELGASEGNKGRNARRYDYTVPQNLHSVFHVSAIGTPPDARQGVSPGERAHRGAHANEL